MDRDPDDPAFSTYAYFNQIKEDLDTSDLYTNSKKLKSLFQALDEHLVKEERYSEDAKIRLSKHVKRKAKNMAIKKKEKEK